MRKYKSAGFKHLHGEMKDLYERGDITAEKLREFEQDCFKPAADTSPNLRGAASNKTTPADGIVHFQTD
ncbi:hypothetical protein AGMMS49940_06860 [Spirochaetia bacterium]|nr:hypothetical protein AGMMS49940_06860 [Spirochaetia bacterium]